MLTKHEAMTLNASLLLEVHVNVDPLLHFNLINCSSATFPLFIVSLPTNSEKTLRNPHCDLTE
jgi:hypothetical protein